MQNPPVHWSEGMFLRPHHFQASDRHWNELAGLHCGIDHPCGYGLVQGSVSNDALDNGVLELIGLKARMRDGTIIDSASNHVDTIDLNAKLSSDTSGQPVMVYLALPVASEGQANVGGSVASRTRYVSTAMELPDEAAGGNHQEISLRRWNHRILISAEDTTGFDLLPLMRLIPASGGKAKYGVDPNYFPPMISIAAWGELAALIRELRHFIGSRIKTMAGIIQDRRITLASQVEGDMEKLMLMHVLNQSYGELTCIAFAPGIHPLVAYTYLCSIAGRCSIFGPEVAAQEFPKYDHDDLATIFRWICDWIRKLINSVKEDECVQRYFVGAGRGMRVALEPDWFAPEWEWYFGVSPINCSLEECVQLLKNAIDWKLGAFDKVEQYMTQRQPGLKLRGVRELPRALTNRGKWLFFQIVLDNEPWKQVQLSQTMGMRVRTEQISNLDSLEGNRRLQVTAGGQTLGLEFAIFAIKKRL